VRIGTIDVNKLRGVADKGLGLTKELVGTIVGNERLEKEGEAQQERATEQLRALRKEVEAQGHEAKADAMEQRQKAAQRAKEARN
jgi:uncharacterized protein YjbJ (UPF0337 family)